MSRTSRWPATIRSCAAIATGAVAPISSATASSSRRTGGPRPTSSRSSAFRSRSAGWPATTSQRPRGRGWCSWARRHDQPGPRRAGGLRAGRGTITGTAEPVPTRVARGHRRLRPQRGGHRGRPGRRGGHRRGRRRPGRPDHRDHRHRRRPPGRHAPRIGRIAAERAQRVAIKQTLKYLRGRTAESVVGELMVGVVAGGGSGRGRPDLRLGDRGAERRVSTAPPPPVRTAERRCGARHRADVPRGTDRRVRAPRASRRPAGRCRLGATTLVPRLQDVRDEPSQRSRQPVDVRLRRGSQGRCRPRRS